MVTDFLTPLENKLVTDGFDAFLLSEKNSLIAILANKDGKMYSEITPDYVLNRHKEIKTDIFSENCEDDIIAGFTSSNGHTYRTNRDDQMNMIGQKDELASDTTITTVSWRTEDAGYIDHTRDEWLIVYSEAFNHKKTTLAKYNTLKVQLTAATTDAAVLAITW